MHDRRSLPIVLALALVACEAEDPILPVDPAPPSALLIAGAWSEPFNLGWPVNTPGVADANPALSPDGLALYYDSDRMGEGAQGARDLWVSRRGCTDHRDPACAWQEPANLGPLINTPHVDGASDISDDGHYLFFVSHTTREDCTGEGAPDPTRPCDEDIFVSWRADTSDDLAWSAPVRLPAEINTASNENAPHLARNGMPGRGNFFFSRDGDLYCARLALSPAPGGGPRVVVTGDPAPLAEINHPVALDSWPSVSPDARELFFFSARSGGLGALDIWTSARPSPAHAWSEPVNVTVLNSIRADLSPKLSRDARTIVFTSNRGLGGGFVNWDIYMATR